MRLFLAMLLALPLAGVVTSGGYDTGWHKEYRELTVTAYCPCRKCCGGRAAYGKTSTGKPARTLGVAVDTSVFPHGTRFDIPGYGNWVEGDDTGSAIVGDHIDIRMQQHAAARKFGIKKLKVAVWRPGRD